MIQTVKKQLQKGFTAVELLITLFIAAIFLFSGYQLYTQVIKDGADADKTARVSNEAYKRLRNSNANVGTTCAASTLADEPITVPGVKNVVLTVEIKCPFGAINLSHVIVTATYSDGVATKVIKHATYIKG